MERPSGSKSAGVVARIIRPRRESFTAPAFHTRKEENEETPPGSWIKGPPGGAQGNCAAVWQEGGRPAASAGLRAHGPPLLEAFAAEDRPPLRWPKGDGRLFAALRAGGFRFRASRRLASATFRPLRLATLAALRLVLKAFIGEKHLFAGSKNELGAAFRALQDLIVVFHRWLPCPGSGMEGAHPAHNAGWRGRTDRPGGPGTGPTFLRARSCDRNPTT